MSLSLPPHPDLGLLKKQAKMLLAAQRRGAPGSCALFRRVRRFAESSDEEILQAEIRLADAQLALALYYGFPSWAVMAKEVHSYPPDNDFSLRAVRERSEAHIPDYAGAGVPLAVVAALNHAGIDVRFMEFVAASGWAFSFGYAYGDESPAYMAIRGNPDDDGPLEVFAFLPKLYGLDYEMAPTADPDRIWTFVRERVDAGTPIMSEHMDGGLIRAYRERVGRREVFLDGTVDAGWLDVTDLQPFGVYSFVATGKPHPHEDILRAALARAFAKGRDGAWKGVPQGIDALQQYGSDVRDPAKDFGECPEWFCWAAFERLMARRCAEVWLRSVADTLARRGRGDGAGDASRWASKAADHYGEAFRLYDRYRAEVVESVSPGRPLHERARTPERIRIIAPLLERGIAEEAAGLEALERVVEEGRTES